MEVDRCPLAPVGTQTSVTVSVHPLVIMNISEHWTRNKAQAKAKVPTVVGALLGKQRGRHMELCNSFELMVDVIDGLIVVDRAFFTTREEQYKEVFSDLDFLGWYTIGGPPTQLDVQVHKQMCEINESPVFLKMDPNSNQPTGKLPLCVYESVLDTAGGETVLQFVELPYDLVTEEAERIGVDHVAKITPVATTAVSTATKPLTALHGAVKMLHTRLKIILSYLQAVHEGKLQRDESIFREVNSLCARLPVLDSAEFKKEFQNQCNDITLMAYLGVLTKTCGSMNQRVMAFNACRRQFLGGLTGMSLAAGGYYAGTNHERIKKFYRVQVCAYAAAPTELQNVHLTMCIALLKLPPAVTPTLQLPSSAGVLMKNRASEIMRFGYPGFDNLRTYEDYVLSYDQRNRTAHWVMEHLTPDRMKYDPSVDRAKCSFKEDDTIHPYFRSRNQDYKGSGFDRGHMAPAGNHRRTQNAINQTFLLSNMTPQVGSGFNRDKWNELEKLVRKLSRHHANVYICTGPLYLPGVGPDGNTYVTYRVIGHSHVAVPTHFFKVVLYEVAPNTYELESWVLPNQAIPDQTPLYNFRVPIDSIERSAGFILFEKLNKNSIRKINGLDNRKFLK